MADLHLLSPMGFRASGVVAGIKVSGRADVGLLLCDRAAAAAAVFTTNKVFAAPVAVGRRHVAAGKLQGVVMNSGNANACTGRQGEKDAVRMCQLAAGIAGCSPYQILPSSTGIIGHMLPMEKVERGIRQAGEFLGNSAEHALLFGDAIMTTDLKRKSAAVQFRIGRQKVVLAGVCKGSGMIGPRMSLAGPPHGTMLAYLTTDAAVSAPLLRKLLQRSADNSFNAVTVDDHMSTNDTAVLLASGLSNARITPGRSADAFARVLDEVCQSLARQIAADGEGATKLVTILVDKAPTEADARALARAIAISPLLKCALNGNDPNWGRIVSAAGIADARFDPGKCQVKLAGHLVFRRGQPVAFDPAQVSAAMKQPEVLIHLTCNLGKSSATCWTCDFSKEYVTINAEYHT